MLRDDFYSNANGIDLDTDDNALNLQRISSSSATYELDGVTGVSTTDIADSSYKSVSEFVLRNGGNRVIKKILVANNGLAAVKGIRSIRKWAYNTFLNERAIEFIVMATPDDLKANAEFIKMADHFVKVPGGTNNNNYANVDLIVEIAERYSVDAVWAGWGHASENPRLPEALLKTKRRIAFIGPASAPMQCLGDKISSTIVAQAANVPTIPWSGSNIVISYTAGEMMITNIEESLYNSACISSGGVGLEISKVLGFPVMIKASEGGGGKGIRKVEKPQDFINLFEQVSKEVPGSPIFIMKVAEAARHLEVQIIADNYNNVTSLYGRDCSVQRRHQKIIEEAPVTIIDRDKFMELEEAAVRLAKMVGYSGAGTVEYLYDISTKEYFFLELNPRLQVEHPTTEMVTDVNIPATQLQIAMGLPLHRIADIRKFYGQSPNSLNDFSLDLKKRNNPKGNVIAARITAENSTAGFKPNGGTLYDLNFRSSNKVWGYFSVSQLSSIHEYADSQFGHVFAHGNSRIEAIKTMVLALKDLSIRGDFHNTVEYLIGLIELNEFKQNNFDTQWLDNLIKQNYSSKKLNNMIVVSCAALTNVIRIREQNRKEYITLLEKGQIPTANLLLNKYNIKVVYMQMEFFITAKEIANENFILENNGSVCECHVIQLSDGGILISMNGCSYTVYAEEEKQATRLIINGYTCIIEKDSDPSLIRSPSPGKIAKYLCEDGDHVNIGTCIAEIEVMKMYMPLISAASGIIKLRKSTGSKLETGDVVATIALDNLSCLKKIVSYDGKLFEQVGKQSCLNLKPNRQLNTILTSIFSFLDGYEVANEGEEKKLIDELYSLLNDHGIPYHDVFDAMSSMRGRIPSSIEHDLLHILTRWKNNINSYGSFIKQLFDIIPKDSPNSYLHSAFSIISKYEFGMDEFKFDVLSSIINTFIESEQIFDHDLDPELIIPKVREALKDDTLKLFKILASHQKLTQKINFINYLIEKLLDKDGRFPEKYMDLLKKLTSFKTFSYAKLTFKTKHQIVNQQLPSVYEQKNAVEMRMKSLFSSSEEPFEMKSFIKEMVTGQDSVIDVMPFFFHHEDSKIQFIAMEIYIRRVCAHVEIKRLVHHTTVYPSLIEAHFQNDALSSTSRCLCMLSVDDLDDIEISLPKLAQIFNNNNENSLYLNIKSPLVIEVHLLDTLKMLIHNHSSTFLKLNLQTLTFVMIRENVAPGFYTFKRNALLEYNEDDTIRHIEPSLSPLLELSRLSNYNFKFCYTEPTGQIHIYHASCKLNPKFAKLFIRVVIRPVKQLSGFYNIEVFKAFAFPLIENIMDAIEYCLSQQTTKTDSNHLFINVLPTFYNNPEEFIAIFRGVMDSYSKRMWKSRILQAEIKMNMAKNQNEDSMRLRFILSNESGFALRVDGYYEKLHTNGYWILHSLLDSTSPLHLKSIMEPHPPYDIVQEKRSKAQLSGTSYVYDFPVIFEQCIKNIWNSCGKNYDLSGSISTASELVLNNGVLEKISRAPGMNNCGMVAWEMKIHTPEYPEGRDLVLIANDINFEIGSFGTEEDYLFSEASKYARSRGIPRIYISANSGARIGLADELKSKIQICWKDRQRPEAGIEFLYLTEEDYRIFNECVVSEPVLFEDSRKGFKLIGIIGKKHGLGVENLAGSALIAGETSIAYEKIFTLSFVTGRSVGIGAYLVRLGQRVIQKADNPIILTGFAALNKVLGRNVYSSNLQIGGTQIMHSNGITHRIVESDLEGVEEILKWLSFVPKGINSPFHGIIPNDPTDREVIYYPPQSGQYDPRFLLAGSYDADGSWISGFLDKDSFIEYSAGWAKTVVIGRGKLGGVPVGVIAVETRTVQMTIPADPANSVSEEQVISQAGQVWFPDSAYKTSQAINDFNHGEQLPLIILANWRGFSGGQRDMFDSVLKFGSFIVDSLVAYKQPVFVYLPPFSELRGGAWVVLDSNINEDMIEMYADPTSRGGVLEPEGIVHIKYRETQLFELMERLDPTIQELKQMKNNLISKTELDAKILHRKKQLMPVYQQIALQFADLHDRPHRMKAKNVIKEIVEWKKSRSFFYQRLLCKVSEHKVYTLLNSFMKKYSMKDTLNVILDINRNYNSLSDFEASKWINSNYETLIAPHIQSKYHEEEIFNLIISNSKGNAHFNVNSFVERIRNHFSNKE